MTASVSLIAFFKNKNETTGIMMSTYAYLAGVLLHTYLDLVNFITKLLDVIMLIIIVDFLMIFYLNVFFTLIIYYF